MCVCMCVCVYVCACVCMCVMRVCVCERERVCVRAKVLKGYLVCERRESSYLLSYSLSHTNKCLIPAYSARHYSCQALSRSLARCLSHTRARACFLPGSLFGPK